MYIVAQKSTVINRALELTSPSVTQNKAKQKSPQNTSSPQQPSARFEAKLSNKLENIQIDSPKNTDFEAKSKLGTY